MTTIICGDFCTEPIQWSYLDKDGRLQPVTDSNIADVVLRTTDEITRRNRGIIEGTQKPPACSSTGGTT